MNDKASPDATEQRSAQALAYLKGEMTGAERDRFEEALTESEELRDELSRARELLDALHSADKPSVIRMVNAQISIAIDGGASDLHLVPERRNVLVRTRVDGYLRDMMRVPQSLLQPLVDRWKVMADMHIAERRLPQDGRLPFKHNNKDYDLRVNVLPTLYGERVTVRILDRTAKAPHLSIYEASPVAHDALRRLARLNSGMVLTSGATGTGKTTLLYALLLEAHGSGRPGRNFLTIEDPVELALGRGITQTAINKRAGLTYAAALSAMLRSDPDVIFCAELRDLETAELATQIALTGHLFLSALHTTSALGIIERLRNIGVENFLIADVLAGAVGQRLVRRVDARQTEEYEPAEEELRRLGLTRADGPFVRGVPIEENGNTGFSGRIPLIEAVEVTPALRRLIAEKAPYEELWRAAFVSSGASLLDDARAKVKAGLTTVEEVNWSLFDYPRTE
jgi:type II secretory ATPase GspE/PulE/Tfp pilus assembly ATPase PilB-like protein